MKVRDSRHNIRPFCQPTIYDLVVTHRQDVPTTSEFHYERSLTVRNNHLRGEASICTDIGPYSKRFVELIGNNKKRAQNRTEYLQFGKKTNQNEMKTRNVMRHFLGGAKFNSASHTSKVSLGKYLIRPSDPSSINDCTFPLIQNDSSEQFLFNRLKDNSTMKGHIEVPSLPLNRIPSINKAAANHHNESFTNRPSKTVIRSKRADGSESKIFLSELKGSNEHSFLFNSLANRGRKKNISQPPKVLLQKKVNLIHHKSITKEKNDQSIDAPFKQMTLLDNLLRPRYQKPVNQNNQHIHFVEEKSRNQQKVALASQVSITFKNDDEYKNLILHHSPFPNFCDYSLNLQRQIHKMAANKQGVARFQNGYNQLYRKRKLSMTEREFDNEDDDMDEQKMTSQQFLNWELKQQEKKRLKAFLLKSKPHQKKKYVPPTYLAGIAGTEIHSQELLDYEEPKSYSRWMELIDSLLAVDSLAPKDTIGYYSTSVETVNEVFDSQSLEIIMKFMMQRVKGDLLAGKKFAFMFRQY